MTRKTRNKYSDQNHTRLERDEKNLVYLKKNGNSSCQARTTFDFFAHV